MSMTSRTASAVAAAVIGAVMTNGRQILEGVSMGDGVVDFGRLGRNVETFLKNTMDEADKGIRGTTGEAPSDGSSSPSTSTESAFEETSDTSTSSTTATSGSQSTSTPSTTASTTASTTDDETTRAKPKPGRNRPAAATAQSPAGKATGRGRQGSARKSGGNKPAAAKSVTDAQAPATEAVADTSGTSSAATATEEVADTAQTSSTGGKGRSNAARGNGPRKAPTKSGNSASEGKKAAGPKRGRGAGETPAIH